MTEQMTPAEVLAVLDDCASKLDFHYRNTRSGDEMRTAFTAVAALIAERDALTADNKALRAAYHKARNAAAGFSNYCEESANARRCERELAEAERMFRDIDAARAEVGSHG